MSCSHVIYASGVLIFAIDNKVKEASEVFLSDSFDIHIFCSNYSIILQPHEDKCTQLCLVRRIRYGEHLVHYLNFNG